MEVKKAYFSLVRKFPPERFPGEFKKIREAYEALSDPESREQYDRSFSDDEITYNLNKAHDLFDEEEYEEALFYYKEVLKKDPEYGMIQNVIGLCHMYLEDFSKAVNVFKSLIRNYPDNPVFYRNYGSALRKNMAYKQAIEAYNRALELDNSDIEYWEALALCYLDRDNHNKVREVLLEGIKVCGGNISVYMKLIHNDISQKNMEYLKKDIKMLEKLAKDDTEICENVAWALTDIAEGIMEIMPEYAVELLKKAKKLDPKIEGIADLRKDATRIKKLKGTFDEMSRDPGIHPWIKQILRVVVFEAEFEWEEKEARVNEQLFLRDPHNALSSVRSIKEKYPDLFNEHKKFFKKILDNPSGISVNEKKLIEDIRDLSGEYEALTMEDIYIPPVQVVNTEKIGRNDPCPCGSGKKYKKCCLNS